MEGVRGGKGRRERKTLQRGGAVGEIDAHDETGSRRVKCKLNGEGERGRTYGATERTALLR